VSRSPYKRLFFHLVAGFVIVVVVEGVFELAFQPARTAYSAEVTTKLIADRVQDDLIRSGITATSMGRIEDFLSGKLLGPQISKTIEPPVIDAWGEPLHVTRRQFMFDKKSVDFGIYSYGPNGKSDREGNDIDDISSWAECDNEYWRGVSRRIWIRTWIRSVGVSLTVGFTTFFLSLLSEKVRLARDR